MTYRVQTKGISGCVVHDEWTDEQTFATGAEAWTHARFVSHYAVRILGPDGAITSIADQRPAVPPERVPMSAAQRAQIDKAFDDLLAADPAEIRKEIEAAIREKNPDVTQDQLDAEWGLVQITFGLGDPLPVTGRGSRTPVRLVHSDDMKAEADRTAFVDDLAEAFIPAVNAERARQGKPPLRGK